MISGIPPESEPTHGQPVAHRLAQHVRVRVEDGRQHEHRRPPVQVDKRLPAGHVAEPPHARRKLARPGRSWAPRPTAPRRAARGSPLPRPRAACGPPLRANWTPTNSATWVSQRSRRQLALVDRGAEPHPHHPLGVTTVVGDHRVAHQVAGHEDVPRVAAGEGLELGPAPRLPRWERRPGREVALGQRVRVVGEDGVRQGRRAAYRGRTASGAGRSRRTARSMTRADARCSRCAAGSATR